MPIKLAPFLTDTATIDHLSPKRQIDILKQQLEIVGLIFNHIYNGVLVTDVDGYILLFNEPYGKFLGVNPAEQIGRHTTEVVENTRMHIVAQTGRPEINYTHRIKGQDMVVQRIPIKKDGEVIAVFGQVMFKDVSDVRRLAQQLSLLESKVKLYEEELTALRSTRYTLDSIVGASPAITALKEDALKATRSRLPVLITGESGTGKELFAQAIHHAGKRRAHPFVRINCSAIPKDLFESELFGYERGAFTGARSEGKPGKFELADKGTIFLDEIGDLPLEMQPKLLRVLEEKEVERVGGAKIIRTDFRLIAATNQNLEAMMSNRSFRKDLFYRLNVIPLHIAPLRERREDVLPLARHLLTRISDQTAGPTPILTPAADKVLLGHDWPGNVRELYNVLEQAYAAAEGETIDQSHLPFFNGVKPIARRAKPANLDLKTVLAHTEKEVIQTALDMTGQNKTEAARVLGIHRTHLYKKMQNHRLPIHPETDDVK